VSLPPKKAFAINGLDGFLVSGSSKRFHSSARLVWGNLWGKWFCPLFRGDTPEISPTDFL
jgi:hypothetical protein